MLDNEVTSPHLSSSSLSEAWARQRPRFRFQFRRSESSQTLISSSLVPTSHSSATVECVFQKHFETFDTYRTSRGLVIVMCPVSSVTHPSRLHLFNVSLMFEPFMDCDLRKAEKIASFY